ncbi:unnamed protein product [Candidula unifasciata]|uniref:C-type lectin domain-containing protein n=1 Tax=Candidula unifasciata TaxID=100452 RepID=A0A8S3Z395_9EUPU|nr:unnamed protein product [Candidula unifasciata]
MRTIYLLFLLSLFGVLSVADKSHFGDGDTARAANVRKLFFTDATFRTKTGEWRYSLSTYYLDRPSAAFACKKLGGQLAQISSEDKYIFITNWLETLSPYDQQQIHVGGFLERNLVWTQDNREDMTFLVWHQDEPTVRHVDTWQESCLLLEKRNGKFKMNDVACKDLRRRFLCEEHKAF